MKPSARVAACIAVVALATAASLAAGDRDRGSASDQPASAEAKEWALATGALLPRMQAASIDSLAWYPASARATQRLKQALADGWGVTDAQTLQTTLSWIEQEGHRESFELLARAIADPGQSAARKLLAEVTEDPERRHQLPAVRAHALEVGKKSLFGWDFERYVNVVRWGYQVGYLGEDEAWRRILAAARLLQETFDSWEDLGRNYLVGREFWAGKEGDPQGAACEAAFQSLLSEPASPWKRLPWKTPLPAVAFSPDKPGKPEKLDKPDQPAKRDAEAERDAKRARKLIKDLAKDKDVEVRAEAAWGLGEMKARDAVPVLTQALSDREAAVRANAAAALGMLRQPADAAAATALRRALGDPEGTVRSNAAGALLALGAEPAELLPVWKRLLDDPACQVRVAAAEALWGYLPAKELLPAVHDCQSDPEDETSSRAAALAARIWKTVEPPTAAPILEGLRHARGDDRFRYATALLNLQTVPAEAIPPLTAMLKDPSAESRRLAVSILGRMGAAGLPAVAAIADRLRNDSEVEVRTAAGEALAEMAEVAIAAIPALIQALEKDPAARVRQAACYGLQEMKTNATEAIPALRLALQDADAGVKNAAERALWRIEPGR